MSSIFVIITGASRGIGQSTAKSFVQYTLDNNNIKKIHLCLLARNENGLKETSTCITEIIKVHDNGRDRDCNDDDGDDDKPEVIVYTHMIDLAELDTLEGSIQGIINERINSCIAEYDHCILINNAGSLGHLGKVRNVTSPRDIQKNTDLNIASSCWLSSYFLKWFHEQYDQMEGEGGESTDRSCTIVNISSLCAISSFPTMAMYCAGKAYRDMYHQTMAKEEGDKDNHSHSSVKVKILNYAPGAIATDMTEKLGQCDELDSGLSEFFRTKDEKIFVKVEDSTKKLVKLVMDGTFESGKHIDYWDDVNDSQEEEEVQQQDEGRVRKEVDGNGIIRH